MTADMVLALLVGHMVGDYLLQNDWMAKNKGQRTVDGCFVCAIHCAVYAAAVATCLWLAGVSWMAMYGMAFITHYPIDRYGLAKRWMDIYGQTKEGPFFPPVYIGVDNGLHLLLMWLLLRIYV